MVHVIERFLVSLHKDNIVANTEKVLIALEQYDTVINLLLMLASCALVGVDVIVTSTITVRDQRHG